MPDDLARALCPHCGKTVGVRPDQFGRRLRCPGCRESFTFEPEPEPEPDDGYAGDPAPAADVGELVLSRPWGGGSSRGAKAKLTARFARPRELVFKAAVQAVRGTRCEVLDIDWANAHLRFGLTLPGDEVTEHDLFAFEGADGGTEVDLASRGPDPGGQFDPYYQAVVREVGKYLLFAADPAPPPPPPPALPPRRDRDDEDDRPRYRRRYYRPRREGADGLGIAGFICGLVGVCLSCLWFLGGPLGLLGLVFGLVSYNSRRRGGKGFAVAGLVLGLVAILLSILVVVALAVEAERDRREFRRQFNNAPGPAGRFVNAHAQPV